MLDFFKQISIIFYKFYPKSFGIGYNQYKIRLIKKILNNKKIILKNYIDERIVEIPWIINSLNFLNNQNILDAGCTLNFNYLIKKIIQNQNKLTFVNLYREKNFFKSKLVDYQTQDISNMKFKNDYFDIITCLSVIEHIGFDNSIYNYEKIEYLDKIDKTLYIKALLELKRVLKPKKWLYLSFPFGKKMMFKNYQQFDALDLENMVEIFNPKTYIVKFYKFEKFQWVETKKENCKNLEAIYKKNIGISSTSVALLKMQKA